MHTALVILGGLALAALFALVGHIRGGPAGRRIAMRCVPPVWLALALANQWISIAHAGYTLAQELPIFALAAAVPIGAARILPRPFGSR